MKYPVAMVDDEIDDAEIGEGMQDSNILNEASGYRSSDQRARAEAADGDAQ